METFFARNRLSAYLDGDLPAAEAREVEAALHRDSELRAEYEALRAGVELLRAHGPLSAPEGFAGRLQIRLAAEPAPTRWRGVLRRVQPEYVGIAAIAALALIYIGTDHPAAPVAPVVAPSVAVAQAPVLPAEQAAPAPSAEAGAAPAEAAAPAGADGVLGNESGFSTSSKPASPARPQSTKPTGEREVFQAAWEREDGASTAPDSAVAIAPASAPAGLYSPAPWRYRLHASGDNPLKDLMAVASALGGRIVDAKGRSIADYPMDEGDSRSVRVFIPSYNVEALQRKLGDIGSVETIATDPEMLYQNGAEVPVAIEVRR
jgi:negative regulator of sigma E activity